MRALESGVDRAYEPLPPHNTDAEEAVLGCLMADPDAGFLVGEWLRASDFYHPRTRDIYAAMLRLAGRGEPCDFLMVCDELERAGTLDAVGGLSYVARLLSVVPTTLHVERYGRIVWRTSIYRQLISAAGTIVALAYEDSPDVDGILHRAQDALVTVTRGAGCTDRRALIRTF